MTQNPISPPERAEDRPQRAKPSHFYAVDFARGMAALAVLVWHYQHFFYRTAGDLFPDDQRHIQPFYTVLWPFYNYGYYAVEFFWIISGFVFSAVYLNAKTSTASYVVNRFSRLYPLHLITLLIVAGLQIVSRSVVGHEQIYENNTLPNFVLQLFMATHWFPNQDYSFNGPTWSLSTEIAIYVLFWLVLGWLSRRPLLVAVMLGAAFWLLNYKLLRVYDVFVLRCGFYFFAGATVWAVFSKLRERALALFLLAAAVFAAGATVLVLRPLSTPSIAAPLLCAGALTGLCALESAGHGARFRVLRWIGDNTYGTYLWHVPIQVAILIVLDLNHQTREIATAPWFLVFFLCLTIVIARLSFVYIERPARERIRRLARV